MNAPTTVSIPDAEPTAQESVTLTLPSGRKAVMLAPDGTHMIQANKLIKGKPTTAELMIAIMSRATLIDGKLMPYEQFKKLPLADLFKLQGVLGERFLVGTEEEETEEEETEETNQTTG